MCDMFTSTCQHRRFVLQLFFLMVPSNYVMTLCISCTPFVKSYLHICIPELVRMSSLCDVIKINIFVKLYARWGSTAIHLDPIPPLGRNRGVASFWKWPRLKARRGGEEGVLWAGDVDVDVDVMLIASWEHSWQYHNLLHWVSLCKTQSTSLNE